MAKQSKATKKFEKKHLRETLDRRKDFAKVRQRHQRKEKKRQRTAKLRGDQADATEDSLQHETRNAQAAAMDTDDFFTGVQLPTEGPRLKKHTGKRKRDAEESDDSDESSAPLFHESDTEEGGEGADAASHKIHLEALAEKDPEFYKYLKEHDAELLEFDEEKDLEDIDDPSDEEEQRPGKKSGGSDQSTVTSVMLEKWIVSISEQKSIKALRQLVLAFRAAAHLNDESGTGYKYHIPDSDIYHEILVTGLKQVPAALAHHIPAKTSASGKLHVSTDSAKFKTLSPLIKSFTSSLHHLLGHLSDSGTMRMTLQSFEPLLPYLLQFRKFLKHIIKLVASIWGDNSSDEATRITAFLVIRRLAVIGDGGIREAVLRSAYEGIVKGSRNTTVHTLPGINLMKNSAVELWGIDQKVSYTVGFTFIRQLAVHLRGAVTKPTKDSYKTIYNWQFVHSLDFWSRVMSTHCNSLLEAQNGKESPLRPLIYPAVQITLGTMRLIPTSTYFPLRFQLVRSLLRISESTDTYIPLSPALLEVLNSVEMKKPAKPATLRPLDFGCNIRAPTSYLKTRVYQDGVGQQLVELFSEFFALWAKSIAYPEMQLPAIVMLKRWLRTASSRTSGNKNGKINQALLVLVQKSEANARWIEERRDKVNFAPKDRAEVESFLRDVAWEDTPLGAFVVHQRKLREQQQKVLEQSRREDSKTSRAMRDGENSDVEIGN